MQKLPLPAGHHTVTPAVIVPGVARLIDFMKHVFGGIEVSRFATPNGQVVHAEVEIGDAIVILGEPDEGASPMPAVLTVYVDDCDAIYRRALEAGASSLVEPHDAFYGHRVAFVRDESGNHWSLHTVVEQVSGEELRRRMARMSERR
ncbi:Glyoxalase family protein [Labilithrix luteola]|uniref:Glyoxalase family protein n=1 Tax=Labilithrix luteola TaxID=1391654 RepID=A0A0K1PV90_9BACT|nr:VOC family protein [Labilithrix luteola]AKU97044.1 Glyoxalase family protein [Labilithrix luteola]